MTDAYTDAAREVMAAAEREARALGHQYVGTEHILLALAHDPQGVAGHVLAGFGLDAEGVRSAVESVVQRGRAEDVPVGKLPWTPRAKRVLEYAQREAWIVGQHRITPEHLLLGLLGEMEGVAGLVLRGRGVNIEQARAAALKARLLMMKVVERVVRPLRATVATKRRMREELLSHLAAIYDEEVERHRDASAALDAAARRFGDPVELSRELSRTLPGNERLSHCVEHWFGWRRPESAMRYVTRLAALSFCLLAAVFALLGSVLLAVYGPIPDLATTARVFIAVLLFTPLAQWVLGVLYYRIRDSMWGAFGASRSLARLIWLNVAFAGSVFAIGLAFVAVVGGGVGRAAESASAMAVGAVVATAFYLLWAIAQGRHEIADAVWASLEV